MFPQIPKSGAKRASRDSNIFHKLGFENVKTCYTRKFLKKICFANHEADCQRRWSKIVTPLVQALKEVTHSHYVSPGDEDAAKDI